MSAPNKKERLELLIQHFSGNKNTDFAKLIGVSPQAISSWLSRQSYDIELIYSKCVGVSAHWLLTGEGEMLILPEGAKKDTIYISNPDKDEIIQLQREQIQLLKEKLANFKKVSTGYVPTPPTIPAAATPDVEAASATRIIGHSEEPARRRP